MEPPVSAAAETEVGCTFVLLLTTAGALCVCAARGTQLGDLRELKAQRVSAVVSLLEAHEFSVQPGTVRQEGFKHMNISVREGAPLTVEQLRLGTMRAPAKGAHAHALASLRQKRMPMQTCGRTPRVAGYCSTMPTHAARRSLTTARAEITRGVV